MNEYLEFRCGGHRFLVASAEIDSIQVIDSELAPFAGRRAPRRPLWLDGHALASRGRARALARGVALRPASHDGVAPCIIVDEVGALIRCEAEEIEPLPRALAPLSPYFSGVWRDARLFEYAFCVRPQAELPLASGGWRRLLRKALLAPPSTPSRSEPRR